MGPRLLVVVAAAVALGSAQAHAQAPDRALEDVLQRVAAYAAGYGEKAAVIVAVEKYTQRFGTDRPRQLLAEFAMVKTSAGWVGYRDVVAVNGRSITDRASRLLSILADPLADPLALRRLSDESARYNIGPISRNFNVPTTVLLLFQPASLARFACKRAGTEQIDGREVWKIDFAETATPTFTMTRKGVDVPMSGTLWVLPADGSVVRTRMKLRNFADATSATGTRVGPPVQRPPDVTTSPGTGRPPAEFSFNQRTIESSADYSVAYRWHPAFAMWLPATMAEMYEGPITSGTNVAGVGRATATASYSEFKRFETGARIVVPQ